MTFTGPRTVREWASFIWHDVRGKFDDWWKTYRPEAGRHTDAQVQKIAEMMQAEISAAVSTAIEQALAMAADVSAEHLEQAAIRYYEAGYADGREATNRGLSKQDGPALAAARRYLESKPKGTRKLTADALGEIAGVHSKRARERIMRILREDYPDDTKGPGRPPKSPPPFSE
jgi:hypothetical protein